MSNNNDVALNPDLGIPGTHATMRSADDGRVSSGTNEEASSGLIFGRFVKRGTADKGVKLLSASTDKVAGLLLFSQAFARDVETADDSSEEGSVMKSGVTGAVAESGEYHVIVAGNVVPGNGVHLYHTAGAGDAKVGRCRATADAGKTLDISAFAQWKTTALSGKIGVLQFDLDNFALASADS